MFIAIASFLAQNYLGPDRKIRVLIEVDAEGPMLLIPKHAFSPELVGGVIGRFTVHNKFLYDGDEGTLSCRQRKDKTASAVGGKLPYSSSSPANLSSLSHNNRFVIDGVALILIGELMWSNKLYGMVSLLLLVYVACGLQYMPLL